jgi:hypothetical protein
MNEVVVVYHCLGVDVLQSCQWILPYAGSKQDSHEAGSHDWKVRPQATTTNKGVVSFHDVRATVQVSPN